MRRCFLVPATLLALLAAPAVSAGSQDVPELTDAAGDCEFAFGNDYADVTAAWIADETATSFGVYLALAKWTEPLAQMSGYTVQFTHQGTQFGVAAVYSPDGWEYSNGYIDFDTGDASNFSEADGSFTPGTPAILMVTFDKSHFPHNSADNQLTSFMAGTVDFKYYAAWGLAGQTPPAESPVFFCDEATSTATYTFTTGDHSMHAPGAASNATATTNTTATPTGSTAGAGSQVAPANAADDAPASSADTPAPGVLGLVATVAAGAILARRRA